MENGNNTNIQEWVDECLASLSAPADMEANAPRALARLRERHFRAKIRHRIQLGAGVAIVVVVGVLLVLPSTRGIGQRLWDRLVGGRVDVVRLKNFTDIQAWPTPKMAEQVRQKPAPSVPEMRIEINTPSTAAPTQFALSPDGRHIVFVASGDGPERLWLRSLDKTDAQPLAGTDGASYPFWSPDSTSVGFFADGKLKRIDIVGGAPQVLADAVGGRGGSWNREGTIVFAPSTIGPLLKVLATGGAAVAATRLETGQPSHRFPQFLPDGRHLIYFVQGASTRGVYAGSLDGGPSKRLVNADAAAVVSPSGFLLFPRARRPCLRKPSTSRDKNFLAVRFLRPNRRPSM